MRKRPPKRPETSLSFKPDCPETLEGADAGSATRRPLRQDQFEMQSAEDTRITEASWQG